jgi:hypothetical protein
VTIAAGGGSGSTAVVLLAVVIFAAYWLPTIVAAVRGVPNVGSVVVINLLLGWTFIGWVVALAMAARSTTSGAPPGGSGGR